MNLFERKQIDSLFWSYYPSKYKNIRYETIYNEVKILLKKNSSRYSCVLSDRLNNEYSNIDTHFWTTNIENIKDEIEKTFNVKVAKVNILNNGTKKMAYIKLNKKNPAIDIATKLGMI
jgi:hypothetical protein